MRGQVPQLASTRVKSCCQVVNIAIAQYKYAEYAIKKIANNCFCWGNLARARNRQLVARQLPIIMNSVLGCACPLFLDTLDLKIPLETSLVQIASTQ